MGSVLPTAFYDHALIGTSHPVIAAWARADFFDQLCTVALDRVMSSVLLTAFFDHFQIGTLHHVMVAWARADFFDQLRIDSLDQLMSRHEATNRDILRDSQPQRMDAPTSAN